MYKNYLFDLYGTIIDIHTNEDKPSLWQTLSLFMNLQGADYTAQELKAIYCQTIANSTKHIFGQKLSEKKENTTPFELSEIEADLSLAIRNMYEMKGITPSDDQIADWALAMRTLSLEHIALFDGAKDMLKTLKNQGKRIYLLSNAQRLFTEPEMRMLDIYNLFDDIFYSSDIGFKKPSWHFYNSLIEKYDLKQSETVMVGNDWIADAWGAADYGIDSIYIHTEQSSEITGELPENCRQIKQISEVSLF